MASSDPQNPTKSPAPKDGTDVSDSTAPPKKRSPIELLGLIGSAAILIGFIVFLSRMLSTDLVDASANDPIDLDDVDQPIAGEFIALKSLESTWRPLREDDRTNKENKVLPELTIIAAPAAGNPGFMKVQFRTPEGEISGDVKTLKIEGETTESIYGTQGIADETAFVSYKFGAGEGSWSIEILESSDYGSGDWKRLAFFTVPNALKKDAAEPTE
ncbi:hypothetical protein OAF27_02560 [Verrucomicrobiales bacterium]|nr:hypothetical protein [Verrucomicrobiales bacterium]